MKPEERRTFSNVCYGGLGKLIVHLGGTRVEIKRKNEKQGEERGGGEDGEGATLDEEELGGIGTAVAGDLPASGVPDGEELGEEGGGAWNAAVVAAQLHQNEDAYAEQGSDGGDVD